MHSLSNFMGQESSQTCVLYPTSRVRKVVTRAGLYNKQRRSSGSRCIDVTLPTAWRPVWNERLLPAAQLGALVPSLSLFCVLESATSSLRTGAGQDPTKSHGVGWVVEGRGKVCVCGERERERERESNLVFTPSQPERKRHREREREREREIKSNQNVYLYRPLARYKVVQTNIQRDREREYSSFL